MLVFGGATDGIAPIKAVKAVVPLLTGSSEVRFEIVPGGHLGMLTGRAARGSTWQVMDEWVDQWSTPAPSAAGKAPTKTGQEVRRRRRRQEPQKRRRRRSASRGREAIGANPNRRYGSAGSRSLGR